MTLFFETSQGRISYDDSGETDSSRSKPIVICIAGIGDLRSQFRFIAPLIEKDGYRVICVDVRGVGESKGKWKEFAPDDIGSDLVQIIANDLKVNDSRGVLIFSNSIGSAASVWASAELQNIVKGLVFFGPNVRDTPQPSYMYYVMQGLFCSLWGRYMWWSTYKTMFKSNPPKDLEDHDNEIYKNLCEGGRFDAFHGTIFASKAKCQAKIKDVKVPILVLMGSKDSDYPNPAEELEWIEKNFPAGLVTGFAVNGAGHYAHCEYPDVCHEQITKWLGEKF